MALYVLSENENTFLFLYFIWLLLNLQMCQIILPDPVQLKPLRRGKYLALNEDKYEEKKDVVKSDSKKTLNGI